MMLITILHNRSQAAVRKRVVGMKTPVHSPLRPAGDVNVSVVKLKVIVQTLALPFCTLPDVGLSGLSLMTLTMTMKSQHQDQAVMDNPSKDEKCAGGLLN